MNVKLFIYIFSLFVILTPSFLFKTKESIFMNFIHALLFSLILYFTYNLVNYNKEPLDYTNMNIEVKGINNLNKLLRASLEDEDVSIINFRNNFDNSHKGTVDYNFDAVNQCPPSLICNDPLTQCEKNVLTAYNSMLRQDPGTLAFKYWVDECKKGLDIHEIEDELAKTDQYKSLIGDSERQYTIQNPLFSSNPDIRCGADFGLDVACCGQTGRITQQYTCPSDQPICNNYKGANDWGVCRPDGGFYGTNAYELEFESFNGVRIAWSNMGGNIEDGIGSWIWSKNNEKVAPYSYTTFEYKYYNFDTSADNRKNRKFVIATPSNCEVIVFLLNTVIIGQGGFERPPYSWVYKFSFSSTNVFKFDRPLNQGLNHFIIFVATKGDTLVPGGLLLCVKDISSSTSQENDGESQPLFYSSSSFTTISRIPPVESDLMKSNNYFEPLIVLYNRRSGAFLKGSADSRFYNNNNPMNITLYKSNVKKLPNDISVESMIFKLITKSSDNSRKFSLFNFAHQRFLGTENGTLSSKYTSEDQENPVWDITYNKDFTISFSLMIWGQKKFLGVSKNENGEDVVSMLTLAEPDENCKWDTVQIETVMGGNGQTPSYSGYIGNYPVNIENRAENYLSVFQSSQSDDIKEFSVKKLGSDCSSNVNDLLLCSIDSNYINEVVPNYSLFCEANADELVIYDDIMVILDTMGKLYYRELYKKNKNLTSWWSFGGNTSDNTNLSISKINGKMNVLYVNDEKLHFRDFDSFLRVDSNTIDISNVKMGIYNFIDNNIYYLNSDGKLVIGSESTQVNLKYIKLFYPNPNEYKLFGINDINKLVYIKNGNVTTYNTPIKHFDIYNNIIFVVHNNGSLIYKVICDTESANTENAFIAYPFNNVTQNNIKKVFVYSDVIYMVDGNNNIYSSVIRI